MTSCTHLTLLSIAKLYIFVNRISAIASRLSFCYSILITKVYPNAYLHNIFTVNKEQSMTQGVSIATKKDGTVYYRAGLYYKNKHISLGSYADETTAGNAYLEALAILGSLDQLPEDYIEQPTTLSFEKIIVLLNFRNNGIYFKNPIYLRNGYFSYYLSRIEELKFDVDDLFYYSSRKIQKRQGHLFVSDYGMQYSILSRYGIRPYAVAGRDYQFVNGDKSDFRYSNIVIVNRYHGVLQFLKNGLPRYRAVIHINGNYQIGSYSSEEKAAIAYNKAVDLARAAGIQKNFPENYVDTLSPKEYADIYTGLKISRRYLNYLEQIAQKVNSISD